MAGPLDRLIHTDRLSVYGLGRTSVSLQKFSLWKWSCSSPHSYFRRDPVM